MHDFYRFKKSYIPTNPAWSLCSPRILDGVQKSLSRVLSLFDVILETLSEFSEGSGQIKIDVVSFATIQTKRFIFLLVAFSKLFSASEFATKGLQSPSVSLTDCVHLIERNFYYI